jgi:hypothetical protein
MRSAGVDSFEGQHRQHRHRFQDTTAYCVSKAGLIQMTRCNAVEFAPNIRVNAVCPGPIDTGMMLRAAVFLSGTVGDGYKRVSQGTMLKRVGHVREIAWPVLYLASDLCRWPDFESPFLLSGDEDMSDVTRTLRNCGHGARCRDDPVRLGGLGDGLAKALFAAAVDRHSRATFKKCLHDGKTDSACPAGYQNPLSVEIELHDLPPVQDALMLTPNPVPRQ